MKEHYCPEERTTISYEGECNWCGEKEHDDEPKCKDHPDAPHGFCRNESHTLDRYVCECEFWEPPNE